MQSANQFFLKHARRAEVLAVNGVKMGVVRQSFLIKVGVDKIARGIYPQSMKGRITLGTGKIVVLAEWCLHIES